jgi:hypothetical protein
MLGPVFSSMQLHFNKEKAVTLKHMVVRLLVPEYGGRKMAVTQTVQANLLVLEEANDAAG